MAVKITIVGLGKIGTSVGLALAKHTEKVYRLGHDIHPEHARRAQRAGAVDKVSYNLPSSVTDADIVFLALPVDQVRETLEIIASDLKEGAVVMDVSPVKQATSAWAQEFLPAGRYFVGLTPVINSAYLHDALPGGEGGHADMFKDGMMGIVAPRGTASAAIKLAADLSSLLGAKPLFLDMVEADSLVSAVHLLPQLLAAALTAVTVNQPGWLEGRKLAGAHFAQGTSALASGDTPEALLLATRLNQEHTGRLLETVIAQLQAMRGVLGGETDGLKEQLKANHEGLARWHGERARGEWQEQIPQAEMPDAGSELRRWFVGKRNT